MRKIALLVLLLHACTNYAYHTPAVYTDGRLFVPYIRWGALSPTHTGMLECKPPEKAYQPGTKMDCYEIEVEEHRLSDAPSRGEPSVKPSVAPPASPTPSSQPSPLAWLDGEWTLQRFPEAGKAAEPPAAVRLAATGAAAEGEVLLSATLELPRWRQGACGSAATITQDAAYTLSVTEAAGKLTLTLADPKIRKSTCAAADVDPGLGGSVDAFRSRGSEVLVADRMALIRRDVGGFTAPPDPIALGEKWTLSTLETPEAGVVHMTVVGAGLGGNWTTSRKVSVPAWKRSTCGDAAELTELETCTVEGRLSGAEVTIAIGGCTLSGCPCSGVCKGVASAPRSFTAWVTANQKHLVGRGVLLTRE